jgi:hypothetical protein
LLSLLACLDFCDDLDALVTYSLLKVVTPNIVYLPDVNSLKTEEFEMPKRSTLKQNETIVTILLCEIA